MLNFRWCATLSCRQLYSYRYDFLVDDRKRIRKRGITTSQSIQMQLSQTREIRGWSLIHSFWQAFLLCLSTANSESEQDNKGVKLRQKKAELALRNHGDAILRLAYSYLHNMADAEDIVQETLLQLMKKAPSFESNEHEKAWLFRVAINQSKNKIKFNQRRRWEELSESLATEVPNDLSFVWEAVGALPVKYREVIHLFYQEDMSTAQIAELLQKQESTVRSLLHRARKQLKDKLKEGYDFEE